MTEATLGNEGGAALFEFEWIDNEDPIDGFLRMLLAPVAEKCIPDTASSLLRFWIDEKIH